MGRPSLLLPALYVLLAPSLVAGGAESTRQPFAVVHPQPDHTKLELDAAGLSALRSIKGLVAPVVVIGPYRSGKSFTLNQLLGVGCGEGFGVGHTRNTQTKGVWVWGEPVPVTSANGDVLNLLFFDTEGFESTGKADVYDDRIFALSTLLSSVLIYNLPESIRESDLEKLSFAAELAKAFYSSDQHGAGSEGGKEEEEAPVRPGSMVWLIQRDFLKGDTLAAMLGTALSPVPNPHADAGIAQLNRIRQGLATIAANSTALGLPQPHLDRTRLCEMADADLDPGYIQRREELKRVVRQSARPKVVRGRPLDGPALADLISEVVTALNERDIPTAGSLVEYFNRELVAACRDAFVRQLEAQALPLEAEALGAAAAMAAGVARAKFEREKFGAAVVELRAALAAALDRELAGRQTANTYESSKACEAAEMACEEALDREASQRLPSTGRFAARFERCRARFNATCVGPARAHYEERLLKAWEREVGRFKHDYNDRLLNGLVLLSLAAIVAFRFALRWNLGESAAWAAFIFLQVWPKMWVGSSSSMFEAAWWGVLVQGWEAVVYNPVLDLQGWGLPLVGVVAVATLTRRRWWGLTRTAGCCGRRRSRRSKTHAQRDLDV